MKTLRYVIVDYRCVFVWVFGTLPYSVDCLQVTLKLCFNLLSCSLFSDNVHDATGYHERVYQCQQCKCFRHSLRRLQQQLSSRRQRHIRVYAECILVVPNWILWKWVMIERSKKGFYQFCCKLKWTVVVPVCASPFYWIPTYEQKEGGGSTETVALGAIIRQQFSVE